MRGDDITCRFNELLGDVVNKIRSAGKDRCVVTTEAGIVLGRLRGKVLEGNPSSQIDDVMELGPTTVRTNEMLESVVERLHARNVDSILVTTSDGHLVGTLYLSDAERILEEYQGQLDEVDEADENESSCLCNE